MDNVTVYLLHFDNPIGSDNPRGKAQHYIGSTLDKCFDKRIRQHKSGKSAPIVHAFVSKGVSFKIARTWPSIENGRKLEKYLKLRYKSARRLCPVCSKNPGNVSKNWVDWGIENDVMKEHTRLENKRKKLSDNWFTEQEQSNG